MASAKQIAANRQNALKSTGPKNTQNVRFNALRHGLRAKILILPDEDAAEFNSLLQDLETEWQPQTPTEFIQVERMAVNYWKLARADRREAFFRLNDMPDRFVDQAFKVQQGFERSFDRAQRNLERMQASLPAETPEPPAEIPEAIEPPEPSAIRAEGASRQAPVSTPLAATAETAPEPAIPDLPAPCSRLLLPAPDICPPPPVSLELCNSRKPCSPPASS
jgi:hypothetical protein